MEKKEHLNLDFFKILNKIRQIKSGKRQLSAAMNSCR
jgi:hypothetical protein